MKKTGAVLAGAVGLAAAGWLGASWFAAQEAEARLNALKNTSPGLGASLRLASLKHERSWFRSQGQAEVRFEPGCAAAGSADVALTMRVDYRMSHLLRPDSATTVEWQATPMGAAGDSFKALFGSVTSLSGRGTVGYDSGLRMDMALPELSVRGAGEALQVAASDGFLSMNGPALAFGWKVKRVVARGGGQAMEAKDISIDMNLLNRHLGTGTASVGVEQVSFSAGSMEGLSLRSEGKERGDRVDFSFTPVIRRLNVSGVDLRDMSLQVAVNGLDTRSVETLGRLFEASCGMQAMTAEEGRRASDALVKIIARGVSLGIPKVTGRSADGSITGELMFELAEAKGGQPKLAAQTKAKGRLEVTGTIIPAAQRDLAVQLGFAVPKGTGLAAAFSYADGLLKVNDRTQDAGAVLVALEGADRQMQTLVAGWSQPRPAQVQAVQATAAVTPTLETAVAAAPAAAPIETAPVIAAPQAAALAPSTSPAIVAPAAPQIAAPAPVMPAAPAVQATAPRVDTAAPAAPARPVVVPRPAPQDMRPTAAAAVPAPAPATAVASNELSLREAEAAFAAGDYRRARRLAAMKFRADGSPEARELMRRSARMLRDADTNY